MQGRNREYEQKSVYIVPFSKMYSESCISDFFG